MNFRSRLIAGIAGLAVIAGLAGAVFWSTLTGWFASSPPPPPEKLTLAVANTYIGSGLLFIAKAQDYLAQEGLDVTLQPYSSGRDALNAALEQQAELGTVGDTPLMLALMKDAPVQVVATLFTAGRAHGLVARRDRGIATPGDLAGKTVGVTLGTDGHFLLSVLLANHGKELTDVRLVGLKPELLPEALLIGTVDAVATWEPWLGVASRALGGNGVVFLSDWSLRFGFHLAGRAAWIAAHPATVQRLLRALIRAEQFVAAQPAVAHALIVAATQNDPAIFTAAGPIYRLQVTLDQSLLLMLEDQARWAISSGLASRTEVPNLLDSVYLDALTAIKPDAVSIVR